MVPSLAFSFDFVITVLVMFRSDYLVHISLKLAVNQLSMSCWCWDDRCVSPFIIIFMTVHMNLYVVLMSLVCFYATCNLCYSFKSLKMLDLACFIHFNDFCYKCLHAWWSLKLEMTECELLCECWELPVLRSSGCLIAQNIEAQDICQPLL